MRKRLLVAFSIIYENWQKVWGVSDGLIDRRFFQYIICFKLILINTLNMYYNFSLSYFALSKFKSFFMMTQFIWSYETHIKYHQHRLETNKKQCKEEKKWWRNKYGMGTYSWREEEKRRNNNEFFFYNQFWNTNIYLWETQQIKWSANTRQNEKIKGRTAKNVCIGPLNVRTIRF